MRSILFGVGAIDCNCPLDIAVLQCEPKTVALAVISFAEFGKLARHLGLKGKAKSDESAVVASVKINDPSDGARYVAFVNCQSHDEVGEGPNVELRRLRGFSRRSPRTQG